MFNDMRPNDMEDSGTTKEYVEVRSEEVQDIFHAMPSRIVRFGSLMVLTVLILLVIGANFVKYPDILPAEISVSNISPPVKVVVETGGEIREIRIKNNSLVDRDQVIAIIENPASFEDVSWLKQVLKSGNSFDSLRKYRLNLGELTTPTLQYLDASGRLELFTNLNLYQKQQEALKEKIQALEFLKDKQLDQRQLISRNLELTQKDFARSEKLNKEQVISSQQFETAEKDLIRAKRELASINELIGNSNLSIASLKNDLIQLELKSQEEYAKLNLVKDQSLSNLQNAIISWNKRYLITAPIKGRITFLEDWSDGNYVESGKQLFWIESEYSNAIGKVKLPMFKSSKVKNGQTVQIKLESYPFEEFGMLLGKVRSISSVPKDNHYLIDVEFPDGLVTSYGKRLDFRQEMKGTASIVTEELSLFDRIFNQFRKIYNSR